MKIVFINLLYFLLPILAIGQDNYDVANIPSTLKSRAVATVRNDKTVVEIKSPEQVITTITCAITVYNKNGDRYATLPVYYNKSTEIKSLKGAIYNEMGILQKKIATKDFKDISAVDNSTMFADSRVKLFVPDYHSYPYTVEYQYEVRSKQNLIIPSWTPEVSNNVSVEKSSFQFIAPIGTECRIETTNYKGSIKEEKNDKTESKTWNAEQIAAKKEESYSPNPSLKRTNVLIVPKNFIYYGKTGNFGDWKEFGQWVSNSLLNKKDDLTEASKQKFIALTKDASSDKDKAKILYNYLQKNTRYISIQIGIGGLEPFPASEVDRLGYGDCKALANYMRSMLSAVNIPSYYCIVEAGRRKESFHKTFANAQDGNHVILCIPFKNDTTWLECTSQNLPFGFLSDFTDDRDVVACTENGGVIMHTPKYINSTNLQLRYADLKLSEDGSIQGTLNTKFYGAQYENHMDVLLASNNDKNKLLTEYYNIDNINFNQVNYIEHKEENPFIEENLNIFIKNYAVKNGNKLLIQPNLFNTHSSIAESRNRTEDIFIERGYADIDSISIALPENLLKNITSEKKIIEKPFGKYEFRSEIKDNKLFTYRKLELFEGSYPASTYEDFFQFHNEVSSCDKGRFNLSFL
ncbi:MULTISPECIES: DUF3857 domain-containing protein [Sphingobacterium]|uniref:DUF3857 domain-containing protein n=1 Tax=Sphingobacterium TaxID=28453 RepID=UPI000EE66918|nr:MULTISPECIES: DUF3857 domain-containing protein [Sphingobacterium]HAK27721.1 hypothetical protein [Sphingobacterium sp.]